MGTDPEGEKQSFGDTCVPKWKFGNEKSIFISDLSCLFAS
jgi:hypothetical protein